MHETLDAAISAHVLWRMRISDVLMKGDLSGIDAEEIVQDRSCDLGRWIHGPGSVLSGYAVFREFKECHRQFHLSIGKIIDLIRQGKIAEARLEMQNGAFAYCSQEVVHKIMELDRTVLASQAGGEA